MDKKLTDETYSIRMKLFIETALGVLQRAQFSEPDVWLLLVNKLLAEADKYASAGVLREVK
jgi:hypothetical protein